MSEDSVNLQKTLLEKIETIRKDVEGFKTSFLGICDGFRKKITGNSDVFNPSLTEYHLKLTKDNEAEIKAEFDVFSTKLREIEESFTGFPIIIDSAISKLDTLYQQFKDRIFNDGFSVETTSLLTKLNAANTVIDYSRNKMLAHAKQYSEYLESNKKEIERLKKLFIELKNIFEEREIHKLQVELQTLEENLKKMQEAITNKEYGNAHDAAKLDLLSRNITEKAYTLDKFIRFNEEIHLFKKTHDNRMGEIEGFIKKHQDMSREEIGSLPDPLFASRVLDHYSLVEDLSKSGKMDPLKQVTYDKELWLLLAKKAVSGKPITPAFKSSAVASPTPAVSGASVRPAAPPETKEKEKHVPPGKKAAT